MIRAILTLLLAGLFATAVVAQEKFTITIKSSAKGDIIQVTETSFENAKNSLTVKGKLQTGELESTSLSTFKEEILEKEPGKRASRLKRVYQKATRNNFGKKFEPSVVGKEILIVRDGKNVKYTVDGKELTGDDVTFLDTEFKDDVDRDTEIQKLFLPKKAVGVNEAWKLDMDAVAKDFSKEDPFIVNVAKSSGTGRLLKTYKKDGKQFGVLEVEVTLVVTKMGTGATAMDLDANSKAKITLSFNGCIDGSSASGVMETVMQMRIGSVMKNPDGTETKIDISGTKKGSRTQEDLTGKK